MSLFKRTSKQTKTENNDINSQQEEETTIPQPNTAFVITLLMKEHCNTPDKDIALQIANKHIDNAQIIGDTDNTLIIATSSYTTDLPILPQLSIR